MTDDVSPDVSDDRAQRAEVAGALPEASVVDADEGSVATELVEVFPNVVAVIGEVPTDLDLILDPLNAGLLSSFDHDHINDVLSAVGNASTVGGNLVQAAAGMQGLYRMADESKALIEAGGRLAVKDGKNLGTIILKKGSEKGLAQARFTPAAGLTAAQTAAAIGPALAMVALQSQLNEVSSLVQRNIDLTSQIIENTRRDERARLSGLVDTVARALKDAEDAGAVPASLWDTLAGKKADLDTECKKYRGNVQGHIQEITRSQVRRRREYLQSNAQAVVFDAFALLSTLKAWVGYQAIAAAVAREAGATNPAEARHFESIVNNTRRDFKADLANVTQLLSNLTRELRVIVELPGPAALKMSPKKRDIEATRQVAKQVLEAIAPLSDALLAAREPLPEPNVLCVPQSASVEQHLGVLRWLLEPEEELRALGIGDRPPHGKVGLVVDAAKGKIASAFDRDVDGVLLAVTDRRILSASTTEFLRHGLFDDIVELDEIRYVRRVGREGESASRVDVITRDRNLDWHFAPDVDDCSVDNLTGILAESMELPARERDELLLRARQPSVGELNAVTDRTDEVPADRRCESGTDGGLTEP